MRSAVTSALLRCGNVTTVTTVTTVTSCSIAGCCCRHRLLVFAANVVTGVPCVPCWQDPSTTVTSRASPVRASPRHRHQPRATREWIIVIIVIIVIT